MADSFLDRWFPKAETIATFVLAYVDCGRFMDDVNSEILADSSDLFCYLAMKKLLLPLGS